MQLCFRRRSLIVVFASHTCTRIYYNKVGNLLATGSLFSFYVVQHVCKSATYVKTFKKLAKKCLEDLEEML